MAITLREFDDLAKNALVKWRDTPAEYEEVRNKLYTVVDTSVETSEHSSISALPTARRRDDGDDAFKGTALQGYTINYRQEEIALEVDITKHMRKFDKYDEINKLVRGNKRSTIRRIEQDVAAPLSYAWSTSYTNLDGETVQTTAPDGLALIDNAHTPNGTSDTYSNELTGNHAQISQTTLENLLELGNGFLDEADGRSVPGVFNTIITGMHTPTKHEVKRILMSIQAPGSDLNDVNVNKGDFNHLIVPYMDFTSATETRDADKAKYCFVANIGDADINGFRLEVSEQPKLETPSEVFESSIWQFMSTGMYDRGTLTANFIAGTKGTGATV